MCFQLHFNVVPPLDMHNHGLEMFHLCKLRVHLMWVVESGHTSSIRSGGGECPNFGLEAVGYQISLEVNMSVILCNCLCGPMVTIAFQGLIVFSFG